jgi:hypothetical protein
MYMYVHDPEPELEPEPEPEPEPYSDKTSEPEPSSNFPVPQPCFADNFYHELVKKKHLKIQLITAINKQFYSYFFVPIFLWYCSTVHIPVPVPLYYVR